MKNYNNEGTKVTENYNNEGFLPIPTMEERERTQNEIARRLKEKMSDGKPRTAREMANISGGLCSSRHLVNTIRNQYNYHKEYPLSGGVRFKVGVKEVRRKFVELNEDGTPNFDNVFTRVETSNTYTLLQ